MTENAPQDPPSADTPEARQALIAMINHDLRNPLGAIQGGASLLRRNLAPEKAKFVLDEMQRSIGRLTGMIENLADFAQSHMAGGLGLEIQPDSDVAHTLDQVIAGIRAGHPDRTFEADIALTNPVACDSRRLGQLAGILIANALAHGSPDTPVRVAAKVAGGVFELSVSNQGVPIDEGLRARLFQPFTRAPAHSGRPGLGLGLYVASEIARAHNGALTVASDETETKVTFRMPV